MVWYSWSPTINANRVALVDRFTQTIFLMHFLCWTQNSSFSHGWKTFTVLENIWPKAEWREADLTWATGCWRWNRQLCKHQRRRFCYTLYAWCRHLTSKLRQLPNVSGNRKDPQGYVILLHAASVFLETSEVGMCLFAKTPRLNHFVFIVSSPVGAWYLWFTSDFHGCPYCGRMGWESKWCCF